MGKNQEHDTKKQDSKWEELAKESVSPEIDTQPEEVEETAEEEHPSVEHLSYQELMDKLTQTEQEKEKLLDKVYRIQADAENAKKRAQNDIEKAHKFGVEKLVKELLIVVDSLERSLSLKIKQSENNKEFRQGIELTLKSLLTSLEKFGVQPINPEGEVFNPAFHEAMSMQEEKDVKPNTIISVLQKGYLLHDRVVRPAMVIVAK